MYNIYFKNGLVLTPNVLVKGDKATILYKGLLKESGAEMVYMHAGYGDQWTNTQDIKMEKTTEGFEATLPITSDMPLKVAFRDNANNWDNNSNRNYTFDVQERL